MDAAVKCLVDASHDPLEHPLVDGLGQCHARELHLSLALRAHGELSASLDLGLEEGLGELCDGHAHQLADLLGHSVVWEDGLVCITLLLEFHVAKVEDGRHHSKDGWRSKEKVSHSDPKHIHPIYTLSLL